MTGANTSPSRRLLPFIEPTPPPEVPTIDEPPSDPVDLRRINDKITSLASALRTAERRAAAAEDVRLNVLGLRDLPPIPISFPPRDNTAPSGETAILLLSDLHWGETVSLTAMDGLNSYSIEIARNRLGRWANTVCELLTKHWSGPPPERVVLILGGDLLSGGIHLELAKTDELKPLSAVRDVAHHLRHAILMIKGSVACPLDIISLPGNHGRTTLKPESKDVTETSHDIRASDFLEMGLRDKEGITFFAPASPDALFSVYGWRILASHGDKIGSRAARVLSGLRQRRRAASSV